MTPPRDRLSYEEYVAKPDFLDFEGPSVLVCTTWADYALFLTQYQVDGEDRTAAVGITTEDADRLIDQLVTWRNKCQQTENEHFKDGGDGP